MVASASGSESPRCPTIQDQIDLSIFSPVVSNHPTTLVAARRPLAAVRSKLPLVDNSAHIRSWYKKPFSILLRCRLFSELLLVLILILKRRSKRLLFRGWISAFASI